jgi:hypothetical protein
MDKSYFYSLATQINIDAEYPELRGVSRKICKDFQKNGD